jgi:hypothetical protein
MEQRGRKEGMIGENVVVVEYVESGGSCELFALEN